MAVTHRKLRIAILVIGGINFEEQCRVINLVNNTDDPEVFDTFGGPASSFAEAADPSWTLELTAYADWRSNGLSDFLTALDAYRTSLDAEDQLAISRTRAATALVAIYKALGGGWEVAPAP